MISNKESLLRINFYRSYETVPSFSDLKIMKTGRIRLIWRVNSYGKTARQPSKTFENTGERAKKLLEYGLKAARRAPQFSKR